MKLLADDRGKQFKSRPSSIRMGVVTPPYVVMFKEIGLKEWEPLTERGDD